MEIQNEFRDIVGFEGLYQVDMFGNIKSFPRKGTRKRTESLLVPSTDRGGYLWVNLMRNSKKHFKLIHRLVAIAFIPQVDGSNYVNHKNGIKTDNRVENLEWCTFAENIKHSWDIGIRTPQAGRKGASNPLSKLTEQQIMEIRTMYVGIPQHKIAKIYGVCQMTISKAMRGITYSNC